MKKSINAQVKIEPANREDVMIDHVLKLFRSKYTSGAVRRIGVSYSSVREKFGFLAIQKGTVLTDGSRNIERSKLIGGHSAGGLDGMG